MKKIVYVGNFDFLKNDAQAQLVYGNGLLLRSLGYDVEFIGSINDETRAKKEFYYDGFRINHVYFDKSLKMLLKSRKYNRQLAVKILNRSPSFVINYGTPLFSNFLNHLHKICKNNCIPIISNVVDVPSVAHGKLYERVVKKLYVERKNYFYRNHADGIIAASEYIYKEFTKVGKPGIIVPPLKDCESIKILNNSVNSDGTSRLKLLYAGFPFPIDGRSVSEAAYKDRLDYVIDMLSIVKESSNNFELNIYGISKEQYLNVVKRHKKTLRSLEDNIFFHGYKPDFHIKNMLQQSDYTINYRDSKIMTVAGYSTKIVDSISYGVPVITTNVGDYSSHLTENSHIFYISENFDKSAKLILALINKNKKNEEILVDNMIYHYLNFREKMNAFMLEIGGKYNV